MGVKLITVARYKFMSLSEGVEKNSRNSCHSTILQTVLNYIVNLQHIKRNSNPCFPNTTIYKFCRSKEPFFTLYYASLSSDSTPARWRNISVATSFPRWDERNCQFFLQAHILGCNLTTTQVNMGCL